MLTNSATAGRKGCRMVAVTSDILFALLQRKLTGSVLRMKAISLSWSVFLSLPLYEKCLISYGWEEITCPVHSLMVLSLFITITVDE